jgi:hypothetical protein
MVSALSQQVNFATNVSNIVQNSIFGGVLAFGGDYRTVLTPDVTHLVTLEASGQAYEESMIQNSKITAPASHSTQNPIYICLPHFFDDCFRIKRRVRECQYLFPSPKLLEREFLFETKPSCDDGKRNTPPHTPIFFFLKTFFGTASPPLTFFPPHDRFLDGHTFYIDSRVLSNLPADINTTINNAGGLMVTDFAASVKSVTCVVLHDRICPEYLQVQFYI